jgi:hypothetical protein
MKVDNSFARNLVAYIENNNCLMEKYASMERRYASMMSGFQEKLAESLDYMTESGAIPSLYKDALFESMKNSPEKVAEFMTKVGGDTSPHRIGEVSASKRPSDVDDIVKFCFSDYE